MLVFLDVLDPLPENYARGSKDGFLACSLPARTVHSICRYVVFNFSPIYLRSLALRPRTISLFKLTVQGTGTDL